MKKLTRNEALRSLIKSLNMTQRTFAALLGVPLSRVLHWLNGTRPLQSDDESLINHITGFRGSLSPDETITGTTPVSSIHDSEESRIWHASTTQYRIERLCLFVRICLMEAEYSDSHWGRLRAKAVEKILEQHIRNIEHRFDLLQFREQVLNSPVIRQNENLMEEKHACAWKDYLSKTRKLSVSTNVSPSPKSA